MLGWCKILVTICFSVILLHVDAAEQTTSNIFRYELANAKSYFTSPLRFTPKQWGITAGVAAVTASSVLWVDEPVNRWVTKHQTPFANNAVVSDMSYIVAAATFSGFALHGVLANSNKSIETALTIAESVVFTAIVTQATKTLTGRSRPCQTSSATCWNGVGGGHSFFSGHTAIAFATAAVVAHNYRQKPWVPIVAYSTASLLSMHRIYSQHHWTSDVVLGAAIGTASGIFFARCHQKNNFLVLPTAYRHNVGITLMCRL